MNERLCSRCHERPATGNGYCATCNADRMKQRRNNTPQRTGALAATLGISLDADICLLVDSLDDAQALLLVEKLYGKEKAHALLDALVQHPEATLQQLLHISAHDPQPASEAASE